MKVILPDPDLNTVAFDLAQISQLATNLISYFVNKIFNSVSLAVLIRDTSEPDFPVMGVGILTHLLRHIPTRTFITYMLPCFVIG
jgi:hypothetical protein